MKKVIGISLLLLAMSTVGGFAGETQAEKVEREKKEAAAAAAAKAKADVCEPLKDVMTWNDYNNFDPCK